MNITEANFIFKALGDETRMRILNILTVGEMCVCNIMEILELPQSKISRHLAYLRKSGLVNVHKDGLWVYYSLEEPQNDLHKNILNCVKNCFTTVDILREDLKKAASCIGKQTGCG